MSTTLQAKLSNLTFKTKATLLAIGLGIIPILAVGAISYIQIRNTSEQQTARELKARAESVADKLNRYIFERNGDVEVLAKLPFLVNPQVAAIVPPADKVAVFDQYIRSYQIYDSIAAFDTKGDLLVQSTGDRLSNNHSKRQYFQDALKTGRTVISDPEVSMSTGKVLLFLSTPIKNSIGQIVGVIRTQVPVERLDKILRNFASKSDNYHILNRNKKTIFISSNNAYLNKSEPPEITNSIARGGMISHNTQRAELLSSAAFDKLQGMQQLPWSAVVTSDEAAAYAELDGLLQTVLAGAGLTSLLTLALATFFADRIAKYIQRTIAAITTSTNEIVDTVQSQEITVNQQANSAIVTAETMNELETISAQTAQQASASAKGASVALSLAEEGTQAVQQTLRGMSGLRESVDEIALQVVNLGEQTGQITNVSDLVADLAKQTNMLALKAAVEAARVGEQGKGFGVVAGEIRKLAEESKKSAQKINTLATDIQTAINRTVMVTDRGTKTVTEGIHLAENTAATFIGVTDAVNNVFLNSQQISAAAKQQANGIQQVLGAMTMISEGSQESAVGMHKVKTSTQELNQIADELQSVVN